MLLFLLGTGLRGAADPCHAGDPPLGHGTWAIRGCNYYPRDYPWAQGAMWTRCPASLYEADCARMQSLGINTVRVFLPVILTPDHAWYADDWTATDKLRRQLDGFLGACHAHGLRAILCFDVDKASVDDGRASLVDARYWLASVIPAFKDDARLLAWDVINEPDADPDPNQAWSPRMASYVSGVFGLAKSLTDQPITVGLAWRGDELRAIGVRPDIFQFHEYSGGTKEHVRQTIENVRKDWPGTPILLGEFGLATGGTAGGNPEERQNEVYKNVLAAVNEAGGVWGTCCWTLWDFPGINQSEGKFGVLHADGSGKAALQTLLWYY